MSHIFRVAELTRALKDVVEGQFPFVWVRGQVSNLARPGSGHIYFSLKDADALLNVVWFKGSQAVLQLDGGESYDPLTGEVLAGGNPAAGLADGAEVLAAGRLTVYAPRGAYQLVAELVQDVGLGKLHLEFEALKRKLAERGWFDQARKRPLPGEARRVAVITAPGGAAIRDFLRIGRSRGLGCEVRLHPVLVQGESAPGQIVKALGAACADGFAQCVVLLRGGGSLEDLWAFNDEKVIRAIVECRVPVLTGVGHEVDVTLADLAADVRAATPSHAAQLLWPERETLAQRLDEAELALEGAWTRVLRRADEALAALEKALGWLSPIGLAHRLEERTESLAARLQAAGAAMVRERRTRLDDLFRRVHLAGRALPEASQARLEGLETRMESAAQRGMSASEARLDLYEARLTGLDPLGPLGRGYALARRADGTFLRRAGQAKTGETLGIMLQDGTVQTLVTGLEPEGATR